MVHCFLIHTLGPGDSQVLVSRVFGPDEDSLDDQLSAEDRRVLQKDKLLVVASHVQSAVGLWQAAVGRGPLEGVTAVGKTTDEASALQEADSSVLRLRAGDPFPGERSVLWLAVQSLAFSLVCRPHENLLLGESALRSLARHCLEHLHMLGPGSEVLLSVDRIDFLLSKLLPHGQLLFLNSRFTQSLEKDISAYMAKHKTTN